MELIDAAYHGDDSRVKRLLDSGADVLATNQTGYTALHWATCQRHIKVVEALLAKGAVANGATQDGRTALHFAVEHPVSYISPSSGDTGKSQDQDDRESTQLALVQLLLSKKADLTAKNVMGRTALHLATVGGSAKLVDALLEAGADIEAADIDGMTPLLIACAEGHRSIVKLLLDKGANVNVQDEDKRTALQAAAARSDEELMLTLVAAGADIKEHDQGGGSLLHLAAQGGHVKLLELLLAKGLDIKHQDKEEKTPLHNAAEFGHEMAVELLIKNGAEADAVDDMGETPLHLAAKGDSPAAVSALIKGGANVEAKNTHGRTPLHVAAVEGAFQVMDSLKLGGANMEAKDEDKSTPLILACNAGHDEAAQKLLDLGADVNAMDMDGLSSLHLAVLHAYQSVTRVLLGAKGIDLDAKDKSGRSAVHIALVHGSTHLVNMLTQAGAKVDETKSVETEMLEQHKDVAQLEELLARCARIDEPYVPHVPVEVKARKGASNKNYLHDGARSGSLTRVKMGLTANHTMDALDDHGRTPLHLAAKNGYHNVVDYLLKKGAIKTINFLIKKSEETALHLAAEGGVYGDDDNENPEVDHLKVLKSLLKHGADPNIRTKMGRTAVHLATMKGYKTVVKELLDCGKTDVNAADTNGKTALHMAVEAGKIQTAELLLSSYYINKNAKDRDGKTPLDVVEKMKAEDVEKEELKELKESMENLLRRYGCAFSHEPASNMAPLNPNPTFGYDTTTNFVNPQYNNPYPNAYPARPASPTFSISSISSYAPSSPRSTMGMPTFGQGPVGVPMFRDTPAFPAPLHGMGDYISLQNVVHDPVIKARLQAVDAGVRRLKLDPFLSDDGGFVKPINCVQATNQIIQGIRADPYTHSVTSRTLQNRLGLAMETFSMLELVMQKRHVDNSTKTKIFGYVYPVLEILLKMGEALKDMNKGMSDMYQTPQSTCSNKMSALEEEFKIQIGALDSSRTISDLCKAGGPGAHRASAGF